MPASLSRIIIILIHSPGWKYTITFLSTDCSLINAGLISLCLRSPTFREMKTEHKSMFNSLQRFFNCLCTESADFCSLNGRTIRTDCWSGVDLHEGAGVCLKS